MAYTQVPDPLLDSGKPGRSTDWKQFRDNQDDHESRIVALESPAAVSCHFGSDNRYTSSIIATTTLVRNYEDVFLLKSDGSGTWYEGMGLAEAGTDANDHLLRWSCGTGTNNGYIESSPAWFFNGLTKPLTFIVRLKFSTLTFAGLFIGIHDGQLTTSRPNDGVWLEYTSATNWTGYTSNGGTTSNTGSFAHGLSTSTWFELKFIMTDDPVDQVEFYIDGTQVSGSPLTTNLPTAKLIHCNVCINASASSQVYLDRWDQYIGGALADAT